MQVFIILFYRKALCFKLSCCLVKHISRIWNDELFSLKYILLIYKSDTKYRFLTLMNYPKNTISQYTNLYFLFLSLDFLEERRKSFGTCL